MFPMPDNAVGGFERLSIHNRIHYGSEGDFKVFMISHTETDGETALRVCVDQQDFEALPCETDTEVQNGRRLADAAFLIHDGNYFCLMVVHGVHDDKSFRVLLILDNNVPGVS